MKNITKLLSFLFFISMFSVFPVSAVIYEEMFTNPIGLGVYSSDTMLVSEGTSPSNIKYFYTDGSGSAATAIIDIPNYCEDAVVGDNGDIFFVLSDGRVYRCFGYGTLSFTTDYNTSFQYLGDVDSLSSDRSIIIDKNNNVYVNGGHVNQHLNVYVFSYPSYSVSLYTDVSVSSYVKITDLALHPDGIVLTTAETQVANYAGSHVYMIHTNMTAEMLYEVDGAVQNMFSAVYCTDDRDIYFTDDYNDLLRRLNYSDSYSVSSLASVPDSDGIHIDSNGVIYVCESPSSTIQTYTSVGLQGGYSYYYQEGSTGTKQLEYDTSVLNTVYVAYNNDSTVELVYNIDIDLVDGFTTQDFYNDDNDAQYHWVVDVLDTNGIKQKTTIINSFDKNYDIVSGWHIISVGNLQYTSTAWENGTWSAVLYEYDKNTGLRAALDSCEFEIYDQVSDTTVIDETPGIDPTLDPVNRIDALLESNAFVGLLIILACIGAFGKIGGIVGVVLGTVAGISLSYLLGYIPAWILFIMIMTLCIVFASKIVGQIGGGNE